MGILKSIVDIIWCLLPSNVWKTHLVKAAGDKKSLKDFTVHDIIQSIQTEYIKPGSQETITCLLKQQSTPQWSEGICTYIAEITKNDYKLTNMGFTTEHPVIFHHLKFHLEQFDQTFQGTSFTKLLDDCNKTYWYSYK